MLMIQDDAQEILENYVALGEAAAEVVRVLDLYKTATPDPTKPNYVNPVVMFADRDIAEKRLREAVRIHQEILAKAKGE